MSGKPPESTAKQVVECPHCSFKQLESPFAKSTFCRKCSEHYDIGRVPVEVREERLSLFDRLGELLGRKKTRDISCFKCGAGQTISSSAKSSLCPHCSAYLDLTDFKIKTAYSRTIETQGTVVIASAGDVSSPKIACGEAFVYGKLRSALFCSGETRVKLKGKFHGSLDVNKLFIERRSDIEALRPIKAKSAEISGKLNGRLQVDGTVTITKKGHLEGLVIAKGINIEKGGIFLGELIIAPRDLTQPDSGPVEDDEVLSRPIPIEPSMEVEAPGIDEPGVLEAGPVVPQSRRHKRRSGNDDDGNLNFGVG